MNKIKTALKSPLLWIGLGVGAVLVLAYRRFFMPLKPLADALPGSDAKKAA